jgi:hypothetical protein
MSEKDWNNPEKYLQEVWDLLKKVEVSPLIQETNPMGFEYMDVGDEDWFAKKTSLIACLIVDKIREACYGDV